MFDKNPEFGIIGVAGTKQLSESGRWWDNPKKMYGQVKHTHQGKSWLSAYSDSLGDSIEEVVLVDGLFFAVHKDRVKEDFNLDVSGFHFYDVDFCFRNYLKGVKVGVTTKIRVNHMSIGETNDEWEENRKTFAEKFKEELPVKIDKVFNGKEKFNILISSSDVNQVIKLGSLLKKNKHNVTICSPLNPNEIELIKRNGLKTVLIQEPPSYKVGDGNWTINTPNGVIKSDPKKLYKISQANFNIVHCDGIAITEHFNKLYPELPIVGEIKSTDNIDEIINEYQERLK